MPRNIQRVLSVGVSLAQTGTGMSPKLLRVGPPPNPEITGAGLGLLEEVSDHVAEQGY